MKSKLRTIILISVVVLLSSCNSLYSKAVLVAIKSPNNKYEIIIEQSKTVTFFDRYAYMNVRQNGNILIQQKLIYKGDYFDGDFLDYYPRNYWVNNFIFRTGQSTGNENAIISVTNTGNSNFKYLIVESSREKLFLFDVNHKSAINVEFRVSDNIFVEGVDNSGVLMKKVAEISNCNTSKRLLFSIELGGNNIKISCKN